MAKTCRKPYLGNWLLGRSITMPAPMRSLRFLPITFLAGQHGFLFFAPYLALFLAAAHLIRQRRHRLAALVTLTSIPNAPATA